MAENQEEMHSAMTEASSSKSTAAQIKEGNTLSWAQVVIKSVGDNQKSATSTKKNKIQSELKKCSTQKLIEERGEIEQRAKIGYLDSSFEQPRNQLPNTDLLSLLSKNKSGGNDTGSQPNPNSGCEKGEVRRVSNSTTWCGHCKKRGHTRAICWCLNPHLRPSQRRKENEGGRGAVEQNKINSQRKGYGSKTLKLKEAEREGEKRALGAACEEEKKGKGLSAGCVERERATSGANASGALTREQLGPLLAQLANLLKSSAQQSGFDKIQTNLFKLNYGNNISFESEIKPTINQTKYIVPKKRVN